MRRLLMASLILLLSSFTGIGTENSRTDIKITKPIIEEAPISIGSKYISSVYGIESDNLPINLPFDTLAKIRVSDVFRYRSVHPTLGIGKFHEGIDFSGKLGTIIKPAAFGIVKKVSNSFSYGNYIIIDHGKNITTLYAHLKSVSVKEGAIVTLDTPIAKLGNTGRSTGPHLHFEVRIHDTPINPLKLICNKQLSKLNKNKIKEIYAENRSRAFRSTIRIPNGIKGFERLYENVKSDHFARISRDERDMARKRYIAYTGNKKGEGNPSGITLAFKQP